MTSFTLQLLCPRDDSPMYPLDNLGGSQSQCGRCNKFRPCRVSNPDSSVVQPTTHSTPVAGDETTHKCVKTVDNTQHPTWHPILLCGLRFCKGQVKYCCCGTCDRPSGIGPTRIVAVSCFFRLELGLWELRGTET